MVDTTTGALGIALLTTTLGTTPAGGIMLSSNKESEAAGLLFTALLLLTTSKRDNDELGDEITGKGSMLLTSRRDVDGVPIIIASSGTADGFRVMVNKAVDEACCLGCWILLFVLVVLLIPFVLEIRNSINNNQPDQCRQSLIFLIITILGFTDYNK